MSPEEIDKSRISDMTWNRPSWPLGNWRSLLESASYFDGLEPFVKKARRTPPLPKDVQKGLDTLGVSLPITIDVLKKKYKTLVKLHHPDLHAGDKKAEERLKAVNEAYQIVKTHLGKTSI
jgi:DnaJ-domain-containing protein 1